MSVLDMWKWEGKHYEDGLSYKPPNPPLPPSLPPSLPPRPTKQFWLHLHLQGHRVKLKRRPSLTQRPHPRHPSRLSSLPPALHHQHISVQRIPRQTPNILPPPPLPSLLPLPLPLRPHPSTTQPPLPRFLLRQKLGPSQVLLSKVTTTISGKGSGGNHPITIEPVVVPGGGGGAHSDACGAVAEERADQVGGDGALCD